MPVCLHKMGRIPTPACIRCASPRSDFWREVINLLSEIIDNTIPLTPDICLFGILDEELWPHYTRTFLWEVLFMARKAIALRWIGSRLPSLSQWRNSIIPLNSIVYKNRGCQNKFGKVWGLWCNSPHTLYSAQSLAQAMSRLEC